MTSSEYESRIPKVEEDDLLNLVFEDITDPSHQQRWSDFAATNPVLAKAILQRSYFDSASTTHDPLERRKIIIDNVTFAIRALEYAARRITARQTVDKEGASEFERTTGDDDGDEDQPPSA